MIRSIKTTTTIKPLKSLLKLKQIRTFATERSEWISSQPDHDYQGLFHHKFNDTSPTTTYLSFLPNLKSTTTQPILPSHFIIGEVKNHTNFTTLGLVENKSFLPNSNFFQYLHETIQPHVKDEPYLQGLAQLQKDGWIHLTDFRNPPPYGRIPEPDDIIATIRVTKGEIQPDTYQVMPTHRPVTNQHGLFQLPEYLHKILLDSYKN